MLLCIDRRFLENVYCNFAFIHKVVPAYMRVMLKFLSSGRQHMQKKKKILLGYLNLNYFMSADDNLWQQLQFSYFRINFIIRENRIDARPFLSYDFFFFMILLWG